ncbi:MAG: glutamate decarboxylase [Marinifilaceae bacterium]
MKTENPNTPIFGTSEEARVAPKFEMPAGPMAGEVAYQIIHDESMMDGNARLNLATFVSTWMDDYANKIMYENMDKNMIDKTEYPQTAEIERRCVNILAKLWNSPEKPYCTGTSTVGSSEACMLGGIAALKRWQERRRAKGLSTDKPNFVITSCFQVVWEKFSVYWDVEMRTVPITPEDKTLNIEEAIKLCDDHTICVVPIQGVTMTGLNDSVKDLNDALEKFNAEKGLEVCIHIDAATGGFILPFIQPDFVWDFRLKWVLSISVSGHKFGLVYPGVGWVVWRDNKYLPKDMNFAVNYLGDMVPSISINFSRPGNQILAQYYQFLRLGMEGYRQIQQNCLDVCRYMQKRLAEFGIFELYSNDLPNPLFAWELKADPNRKWTLYDLSDELHVYGWQIPAYTLPANMEETIVMRIVVRQGTGIDLADLLMDHMKHAIAKLDALIEPTNSAINWKNKQEQTPRVFNHNK